MLLNRNNLYLLIFPWKSGSIHFRTLDGPPRLGVLVTDLVPDFRVKYGRRGPSTLGLLVDSEIVLSTRYGKTMVFINKTLSTEAAYQQDLINRDLLSTSLIVGKVGPGMWCGKFNSTSNVIFFFEKKVVKFSQCDTP
jgi:hypothetical protein